MNIKFVQQENKKPTFGDVKVNQFFINLNGCLCQKVHSSSYICIASHEGDPYADYYTSQDDSIEINKVLPEVERIEF